MIDDIAVIGVLVLLEGVLSIDNALVLAVLARSVKPELQKKVLTYGLIGAVVLRMTAIFLAQSLLQFSIIKIAGAAYLLYLCIHFFVTQGVEKGEKGEVKARGFWTTILLVELADLAFAVDSILAAVAMTDKYWVIVTGGLMGTVMMRFAAAGMIKLLNRFPKMEATAFMLVGIVGLKLGIEAGRFEGVDFHSHSSPWFWGQWIAMAAAIGYGLKSAVKSAVESTENK
jgi:YkoY family integral membrane protein